MKIPKKRIARNAWDNWYGYEGTRRVISFANTSQGTQEQHATAWLKGEPLVEVGPTVLNGRIKI
jgi:hypothetical protein